MGEKCIGLLGATSLVGECLIPQLGDGGWRVVAFSRNDSNKSTDHIEWRHLISNVNEPLLQDEVEKKTYLTVNQRLPLWICVAPIWVLPEYFKMLETYGVSRIVVLSSTSRFTKVDSSDQNEYNTAVKLAEGEKNLRLWAESNGIEWIILRPTLIYGLGKDKNISEIARFIRRFGFFPLLGRATGLRQPVHAEDVATACATALVSPGVANHAYNLSGGETLSYREMIGRVFVALNRREHLFTVPQGIFWFALACLRLLPRYRHWSAAMAERMNQDLVFDHKEASRDLNFAPRPFHLTAEEISQ